MSVHVMSWVFKNSDAEGNDRLCLLVLANYADEDGVSWPSLKRIAREMRVHVRTAQRCLRSLADHGHLEVVINGAPDSRIPGNYKPNAYRIRGDNAATPAEIPGVTPDAPRGDSPGIPGVTLLSPKPPIDPSGDPPVLREAEASLRTDASFSKADPAESSATNGSKPKTPAKPPKPPKLTPDTFVVTPEMLAWAKEACRGSDVVAESEKFLDHWRAGGGLAGKGYKDSIAGWRLWMRRSKPGGLAPWKQPDKTNRNPANTYGDEHRVGGGRVIQ